MIPRQVIPRYLAPLVLVCSIPLPSQSGPQFHVTPAVRPGTSLQLAVIGPPALPFMCYADAAGGPVRLLGEDLFLDLGPALLQFHSGTLDAGGFGMHSLNVPAALGGGLTVYMQAIVLDAKAPNGVFRATNGESTSTYTNTQVLAEEFVDPAAQGYTGTFDATRRHRLQAAPVRYRTRTVRPQQGWVFQQGLPGPLNPDGARVQMLYRAADIGATGLPEVLVAMRWLPFGQVVNSTFPQFRIDIGHSSVVPDFTVDPFSALPKYPNSGLNTTFAQNPKTGETQSQWSFGSYTIRPQDVRPDGFVSYPQPTQQFVYNGFDSLLIDFKTNRVTPPVATNGQTVQIMVLSSPQPNARIHASGTPANPVNPATATTGQGDNTVAHMQFEFASVESVAEGPWRAAPVAKPDYHSAIVAASLPPGTWFAIEYQGATSANGAGAGGWWHDINFIDGMPFLQMRIHLFGDALTGAVPSIESIVIPIN